MWKFQKIVKEKATTIIVDRGHHGVARREEIPAVGVRALRESAEFR